MARAGEDRGKGCLILRGIKVVSKKIKEKTRIHSSRMRTVRCSGRLVGGSARAAVLPGGCLPEGVFSWGGLPRRRVSAGGRGDGGVHLPPVDRQTPVTTFANFVCGR